MSWWDRIKKAVSGAPETDEAPPSTAPVARRPASLPPPAVAHGASGVASNGDVKAPESSSPVDPPEPLALDAPPAADETPAEVGAEDTRADDPPRRHHHVFAHAAFPANLWSADSLLGILVNPENQDFLREGWAGVGSRLDEHERLDDAGLSCSAHWIGGEHLVLLVVMPPALRRTEAHFVALLTSPKVRYLTLERGADPESTVLGEWTRRGEHANLGAGPRPEPREFLHAICRHLGLPESVEAPLPAQLLGLTKTPRPSPLPEPPALSAQAAIRLKTLETSIEQAFGARDGATAERLCREALALRLDAQGVESPDATLMHAGIAQALLMQGRADAAEEECRAWWKVCRRHRALAHQESLLAMRMLATCLAARGDRSGALSLLTERALIAGLSRGEASEQATRARTDLEQASQRTEAAAPAG